MASAVISSSPPASDPTSRLCDGTGTLKPIDSGRVPVKQSQVGVSIGRAVYSFSTRYFFFRPLGEKGGYL
ncbi:hypothetical protein HYQ46_012902 [Verticillium longisporum]|nr:hypothetical protein HYQ46_012902 [Verticillium longisporum]